MASASSAWLDIFVGDRSAFEAQDAAYKRTQALLTKVADTYGLPNHVEDLDEEGRETLQSSNVSWEKARLLSACQCSKVVRKPLHWRN